MKTLVLSLSLFSLTLLSNAQEKNLTVEISRSDPSTIEVTDNGSKYVIKPNDQQLSSNDLYYQISRGKGGQKDKKGIRERRKRYLITSQNDTLATIQDKVDKINIGNNSVYRKKSENGWVYLNEENDTLYTADLYWNENKWKYHLKTQQNSEIQETLHKVVLLSLVEMAQKRSKTDCDDYDTFSSLWYILYIATLSTN